jgi:hypothetical protein
MSWQAHIPTTLARTSQQQGEAGLLLALATQQLGLCNSPPTPSPKDRFFARRGREDDGERSAWITHSLLLQPDRWEVSTSGSTAVRLHQHPEHHASLQTGVSIERHLSRIFPAHPRSLASVLIPRPAARRVSASATPPYGLRLSENLLCKERKNDFPNLP